jgi:hypothetical protein
MSFYFKNKTFNSKNFKIVFIKNIFFLSQNVGAATFNDRVILPASHFTNLSALRYKDAKLKDTQYNGTHHYNIQHKGAQY